MWPFSKKQKKTRAKRNYYSAASMNRLSNDWTTIQSSSRDELKTSLRILRSRSRDLSRNNDYAKRYFNLAKTNVIGHQGPGLQSKALDDNSNLDTYANHTLETAWKTWEKVGNCDVTRRLSWIDCCKLVIESVVRDGDLLAVSFEGPKRGPHRFQIKLIDPDLLDENYNESFADGHIAFYPPCIIQPKQRIPTGAPVVSLWGLKDDSTPKLKCDGFLRVFEEEGSSVRTL